MKTPIVFFVMIFCHSNVVAQTKSAQLRELLQMAENEQRSGRYAQAVDYYSKCLTIDPAHGEAYLGRAQAKDQLKDHSGALTDYSIFLELNPDHYDALLSRANTRFKVGQFEQAREDYLKLLTLPPGETNTVMFQKSATPDGTRQITTAQSNLKPALFNYLGLTDLKLNRLTEALAWLDSAIQLEPREADYYVNRGMIREKADPESAAADYEHALRLNPNHSLAMNNLGVLKGKAGNENDYLDQAIESDSSMLSPYLERAYQRMQGGFFKGALEDYNSAIAIEKKDPEIWLNRGFVKERLNDFKGAYADYTQALRLDEAFEKAWLNRGNVLNKLGRYAEAVEDYSTALTFDPEYGSAYYNRAIAYEKLKQRSEACADLKKAETLGMKIDSRLRASACK